MPRKLTKKYQCARGNRLVFVGSLKGTAARKTSKKNVPFALPLVEGNSPRDTSLNGRATRLGDWQAFRAAMAGLLA